MGAEDNVRGVFRQFVDGELEIRAQSGEALDQCFCEFGEGAGVLVSLGLYQDKLQFSSGAVFHHSSRVRYTSFAGDPACLVICYTDTTRFLPVFFAVYMASSARLMTVACVSSLRNSVSPALNVISTFSLLARK